MLVKVKQIKNGKFVPSSKLLDSSKWIHWKAWSYCYGKRVPGFQFHSKEAAFKFCVEERDNMIKLGLAPQEAAAIKRTEELI